MNLTSAETAQRIANKHRQAMVAGDIPALRECYTEDGVIWHNFDGKELTVDGIVSFLTTSHSNVVDFQLLDVNVYPTSAGYVQQHRAVYRTRSGKLVDVPVCFVVTLRGDRIARLETYLDSVQLAAINS